MMLLTGVVLALLMFGLGGALLSGRLRGRDGSEIDSASQPLLFWLALAILAFCIGVTVWQFGNPRPRHMMMLLSQPTPLKQADQTQ